MEGAGMAAGRGGSTSCGCMHGFQGSGVKRLANRGYDCARPWCLRSSSPYGGDEAGREGVLGEAQQQAALANACAQMKRAGGRGRQACAHAVVRLHIAAAQTHRCRL